MSRTSPAAAVAVLCCFVMMCGTPFLPGCEGCRHDEKSALLDILDQFDYYDSLDWSSRDCCEWDAVTCSSRTGRVTGLDLSILESIGSGSGLLNATTFLPLQELRNLSLNYLYIQGCYPGAGFEVWSKLRKLEILDLSNNKLDESSITSLVAFSSLRSLLLHGNAFSSNLTIQGLSTMKLHTLDLGNNYIHGKLATDICNMGDLQELHLSGNILLGELPSCMKNLASLRILDLSHNTGLILKFPSPIFPSLTSLVKLSLLNNCLEGVLSLSSLLSPQLTHLELASNGNGNHFQVQTENPATHPSAQLKVLVLRNCNLNGNSSVIPSFLLHQHALETVDMPNNNLTGYFPLWLIDNNVNLSTLVLRGNSFTGPFLPSKVHTNLHWMDASHNRLRKLPVDINTTLPNLRYLTLSGNYFRGTFPSTLSYMDNLQYLDLSYNNFLDNIASAFVGSMSNITALKLSGNHFYGAFPQDIQLPSILHLLMDENEIKGELPQKICDSMKLMTFDASNNELTGHLPTCIYQLSALAILKLKGNSLTGSIPSGLCGLRKLVFLDISSNNLSGPVHCLPNLYHVHMSENRLNGTFPIPLSVGTNIYTVDLRDNQFSGILPELIGKSFPNLKVLLLKGNMFNGIVPNDVCNLRYLRLLDLSHNKLSGQLPLCLYIMGLDDGLFNFEPGFGTFPELFEVTGLPDQEGFMTKGRQDNYRGNILNYMTGLDFSSNQLKGSIHESIGDMKWLRALNFSENNFDGSIPQSLSNLSDLESLDLSHNKLAGQIPSELAALPSLEVFSVAYNNLSGPTPGTKGQFITFDQSSYEGNPYLCGPPFLKSCSVPELEEHGEEDDDKVGDIILFGCSAMFYMAGFWTSLGVLYFKASWRWSWFSAVDMFSDFVMVKLAIYTRKIRGAS
ncbi:receptor-like protein 15 [Triticum dicoccoides]|uniref:receptor-like protein 15 n=1 Tax=Triticum dicoccoides TaxID=85692 RepID=UPI0018917105|nr:receptor-like protein 15 [Triticum dicoccoides]